jgi:alpha-L-rhamnosidase
MNGREHKTFGSQSADTLALHFDLVPGDRAAIARSLADDVRRRGHWLVGGMVSYPKVGDALGGNGYAGDAIKGLLNTKREGIGWTAANGYTSIWEVYHPFGSFQERSVSKNHANFGGIASWFFEGILGIRPDPAEPGFKHIILRPEATQALAWARGSYRSPYGVIRSDWRREQGKFVWRVTVPPNTRATADVPRTPGTAVTESGRPVGGAAGVRSAKEAGEVLQVELDAGEYLFEAR